MVKKIVNYIWFLKQLEGLDEFSWLKNIGFEK
jgi:hypothetical protein